MTEQGVHAFAGKRVLLLQGPVGPFFYRLRRALEDAGATVFKINFNAGDWFFYPRGALNYRGTMADWPHWLRDRLDELKIDALLLFGDCRPIHRDACRVAASMELEVGVFEEGYIRPNYVTLERHGVNGHSRLERDPATLLKGPELKLPKEVEIGRTYWPMVWDAVRYFAVGALGSKLFPQYRHHRPMTLAEGLPWVKSAFRKLWYRVRERGQQEALVGELSGRYFLVPLQVHNDAQVTVHAQVEDIAAFITILMESFARCAPQDTQLVIKHHPLDRGYRDYTSLIAGLAKRLRLVERVLYIHDQHLPSLLSHARGAVVINSTVGMSALCQGVPTKAHGHAIYDIPGLTFQGSLDDFWTVAPHSSPDPVLYRRFHNHVVHRTQLNGSFYKPLKHQDAVAGLIWRTDAASEMLTRPGKPHNLRSGATDQLSLQAPDVLSTQR